MKKADRTALIALPIIILVGLGIALAGGQGGSLVFGIPLFAFAVGLAFLIQWLAFIPAFALQSEKFFDITGSMTYISVAAIAVLLSPEIDGRSLLLLGLVVIWAGRLGVFLFRRVHKVGKDSRFDEIKPSFFRFLMTWTLQGLWVTFTVAAALAAITTNVRQELGWVALIGFLVWLFGFGVEVVADNQKNRFRENPA
ncbi:MAG: DUF1295 domain-containing protein, partial [Anaerolineales bacterium]|nr:DUF1295 domain-containing protein [Anaerolineales bacterium]